MLEVGLYAGSYGLGNSTKQHQISRSIGAARLLDTAVPSLEATSTGFWRDQEKRIYQAKQSPKVTRHDSLTTIYEVVN